MRARYGASPLHLLAHLIVLPLVAFALLQIVERADAPRILIWLALSAVVHDLVLLPFYGLLDRVEQRAAGRAVNYVRVPRCSRGCCCSCSSRRSPARARAPSTASAASTTTATSRAGC